MEDLEKLSFEEYVEVCRQPLVTYGKQGDCKAANPGAELRSDETPPVSDLEK